MEQELPKAVLYVNAFLTLAIKLGALGIVLGALWKALDWVQHKVDVALADAKEKTNQVSLFSKIQIDDLFFDTITTLSDATFQGLKKTLQAALEDGTITPEEYKIKLHDDVKERWKEGVSTAKKELLETAFGDIEKAIDAVLPAVVKKAKDAAREAAAPTNGAVGNS